jgi:hypothetical protein
MHRSTLSCPRHYMELSGELHAPTALPSGKEPPAAHCIGGWVDPRARIDDTEKWKFLTLSGQRIKLFHLIYLLFHNYIDNNRKIK